MGSNPTLSALDFDFVEKGDYNSFDWDFMRGVYGDRLPEEVCG